MRSRPSGKARKMRGPPRARYEYYDLQQPEIVKHFSDQFKHWIKGRTLILTKNQYLGLAPALTRPDDHVAILLGLQMPAVLRPQEDGSWTFIGVTYIPGFMKRKAMDDLEQGLYKMEELALR